METTITINWVKPYTQQLISNNGQQQMPIGKSKTGQAYNDVFSASSNMWLLAFLSQKHHFEVLFGARLSRARGVGGKGKGRKSL